MEFGVRGTDFPGKPTFSPGYWEDGTRSPRTNIAAFQQLWFDLVSAQLGFTGTSKWDAYWGMYDRDRTTQSYWTDRARRGGLAALPGLPRAAPAVPDDAGGLAGRAGGARGRTTTGRSACADQPEKEIAAYADAAGHLTLIGLDSHGRGLNTVSSDPAPAYSIGGLPANTAFNLVLWNATGNGENSLAGTVTTDAAGVARFEVPLQAAFSLTTVPVS